MKRSFRIFGTIALSAIMIVACAGVVLIANYKNGGTKSYTGNYELSTAETLAVPARDVNLRQQHVVGRGGIHFTGESNSIGNITNPLANTGGAGHYNLRNRGPEDRGQITAAFPAPISYTQFSQFQRTTDGGAYINRYVSLQEHITFGGDLQAELLSGDIHHMSIDFFFGLGTLATGATWAGALSFIDLNTHEIQNTSVARAFSTTGQRAWHYRSRYMHNSTEAGGINITHSGNDLNANSGNNRNNQRNLPVSHAGTIMGPGNLVEGHRGRLQRYGSGSAENYIQRGSWGITRGLTSSYSWRWNHRNMVVPTNQFSNIANDGLWLRMFALSSTWHNNAWTEAGIVLEGVRIYVVRTGQFAQDAAHNARNRQRNPLHNATTHLARYLTFENTTPATRGSVTNPVGANYSVRYRGTENASQGRALAYTDLHRTSTSGGTRTWTDTWTNMQVWVGTTGELATGLQNGSVSRLSLDFGMGFGALASNHSGWAESSGQYGTTRTYMDLSFNSISPNLSRYDSGRGWNVSGSVFTAGDIHSAPRTVRQLDNGGRARSSGFVAGVQVAGAGNHWGFHSHNAVIENEEHLRRIGEQGGFWIRMVAFATNWSSTAAGLFGPSQWNQVALALEGVRMTPTVRQNPIDPVGINATYGQTLDQIALNDPRGVWSWDNAGSYVGDVGTREFFATFTPFIQYRFYYFANVRRSLPVTISPAPLQITHSVGTIVGGVGQPLVATVPFTATRTGLPVEWSIDTGNVPAGVMIDDVSGELTGTPAASGVFVFTVTAISGVQVVTSDFVIIVTESASSAPTPITVTTINPMRVGETTFVDFAQDVVGMDIIWSYLGNLPRGLELCEVTGILSGTPTTRGMFNFRIVAANAGGYVMSNFVVVVQ